MGIVAKMDMSDVREPFLRAGLIVVFLMVLVVSVGAGFFLRLTNPMIRKLKERKHELEILSNEMEQRIVKRTAEINKANEELRLGIEERKRAERAVRESEERYTLAISGSTDGIWDWDILLNTVFYSDRFREILGYSSEEFPGTIDAFRSRLHPEDTDVVWTAVERHLKDRVPYNIEYRLKTKSGEYRWFLARGQAIWDNEGNATRMSGSLQDITDPKQTEELLRESEKKYRLLLETLPAVVYKGYKDWSVEFIDNKIEVLTGHNPDTFNSGSFKWSDVIVKEDIEAVKDSFIEALKTDKVYTREYRIRDIFGKIKWIQDKGNIVYNNRGEVEYIIGVFFDITDRIKREAEFQKTRKLLQTVFDGIPNPLVLLDESLNVKIINDAAMRYYQLEDPEDIEDKCCYEALLGKLAPCDGCQVPAAVASGKSVIFERISVMNPNRLEQVNIYQFDEKGQTYGGALMSIHDITELRFMERQIIHNEKLATLGLMVSCINHEITNPISAITFNAPILKDYIKALIPIIDDYAKDREDFELFQMPYIQFRKDVFKIVMNIFHASKRVNAIIYDLRKFYGKKKEQKKYWIDLKHLIEKTIAVYGMEIDQNVISLEINLPKNLPKIFTDPDAVEQILTNLLTNAAQAADKENSWVKLNVTQGNTWKEHVIIELSDNGCGMDKETLAKIFNPFFTTKAPGQGTGLGLYVCQDLVEDLDGRIEVQSEPGRGSVFKVILPNIDRRLAKRL
jgi:PAS domain S-box-containing protein